MTETSKEILIDRNDIARRVREVAGDISRDFNSSEIVMIGVLKGSFIFMADLIREINIPCQMDFIRAASYGSGCESSGRIAITKDIELEISGRDVLVVEDIVDTGLTLKHIVEILKERNPRSLKVCAFLDKPGRRKVPFKADYVCFTIDDAFVVGYGLDFNENYRHLPDVCVVET
jgi:hypoxanthine phosphoribosyltransferase